MLRLPSGSVKSLWESKDGMECWLKLGNTESSCACAEYATDLPGGASRSQLMKPSSRLPAEDATGLPGGVSRS